MAKKTASAPVAERRGVPLDEPPGSWETMLVRGADNSDLDAIAERLEKVGFTGPNQRDVAEALWSGELEAPSGKWALLGKLKGHDWCFLCPSFLDYKYPPKLAAEAGLQVLFTGHQDTASATYVFLYDGSGQVLEFQSVGFPVDGNPGGMTDTVFKSDQFERAWLKQFENEFHAQSAIVAHFGGYAPFISLSYPDTIELSTYAEDLESADAWERIDLLVMEAGMVEKANSKVKKSMRSASAAPAPNRRSPAAATRTKREPSLAIRAPKSEALPAKKKLSPALRKILTLPAEITLNRSRGHKWHDPQRRDAAEAALKEMGYSRIALFVGDIFVNIRLLAMVHFGDDAYAVIGEGGERTFTDIFRLHEDGGGLTVTSGRVPKSLQIEGRHFKTIHLPGKSEKALVETLRATPPPKSGIKPVNANRFKEDYEWFYEKEMLEKFNVAKRLLT